MVSENEPVASTLLDRVELLELQVRRLEALLRVHDHKEGSVVLPLGFVEDN